MTNPPGWNDEMRWQAAVHHQVDELRELADREPCFSGARIDYASRSFWLYGAGEPSPQLAAMIDQEWDDLVVHWQQVRWSRAELQAAMEQLSDVIPGAVTMSSRDDYSGLVVGVLDLDPDDIEHLDALAREVTDVPVTFEPSEGVSLLI